MADYSGVTGLEVGEQVVADVAALPFKWYRGLTGNSVLALRMSSDFCFDDPFFGGKEDGSAGDFLVLYQDSEHSVAALPPDWFNDSFVLAGEYREGI